MPFALTQNNWKWFQDDAASPSTQLAAENNAPIISPNQNIIRLRFIIHTTGGSHAADTFSLQYSYNDASFTSLGSAADWNYADGKATVGATIAAYKCTGSTASGHYHETSIGAEDDNTGELKEVDFAIKPLIYIPNQTYYFQAVSSFMAGAIGLDSTKVHPYLTMAGIQIDKTAVWKNASQIQIVKSGVWKTVVAVQIAISGVWRDIT